MDIIISEELSLVLNYASEEAMRTGTYDITADHLVLGMLRQGDNDACRILQSFGISLENLKNNLDARLSRGTSIPYGEMDMIELSRDAQNAMSMAVFEASLSGQSEVTSLHLLLAITRSSGSFTKPVLADFGVDHAALFSALKECGMLEADSEEEYDAEPVVKDDVAGPENLMTLFVPAPSNKKFYS